MTSCGFGAQSSPGTRSASSGDPIPATLVRVERLELPRLAAPEPKSGVSTNFTIPAPHASKILVTEAFRSARLYITRFGARKGKMTVFRHSRKPGPTGPPIPALPPEPDDISPHRAACRSHAGIAQQPAMQFRHAIPSLIALHKSMQILYLSLQRLIEAIWSLDFGADADHENASLTQENIFGPRTPPPSVVR